MPYNHSISKKVIAPIYVPWILSEAFQFYPLFSYFIAWIGSFIIFYLTLCSSLRCHSLDLPLRYQVMRPIVLIQIVFAGFMCCTSIFYFLDHIHYGYIAGEQAQIFHSNEETALIAKCQRLSLLAHSALVTGIILMIKPFLPIKNDSIKGGKNLLIKIYVITYLIGISLNFIPLLNQFKQPVLAISTSCSAYILIKGLMKKRIFNLFFGGITFGLNVISSTLTGYKEGIIINIILIGFLAFPYYKKIVLVLVIPFMCILTYILPTFTSIIRAQSWVKQKPVRVARAQAYQFLFDDQNKQDIINNNWDFLTKRFSEIEMFTKYINQEPEYYSYCGRSILINSCYALIPRAIWEEKPNTEQLAMERVYKAGIVQRSSAASAKTRPVVDGYLIAGAIGVFISMLIYGVLAQAICNKAECLFGGYQLGCIIIYNSVFQAFWRGNAFEFLINTVFYGYILMYLIYWFIKKQIYSNP